MRRESINVLLTQTLEEKCMHQIRAVSPKIKLWDVSDLVSAEGKGDYSSKDQLDALLAEAERPYIYTGGGVILSDAADELKAFAELLGYPVTNTLMGLGGFPGTHKNFVGMLGMHGTAYANHAVNNCDLLIAVGARFDDRVTGKLEEFAKHGKIVRIHA